VKKIAIVDDFEESCQLMSEILSNDYYCQYVCEANRALEFIGKFNPDLIILDYKMPHMSGVDVCRLIKEGAQTRNIPVIFVSGAVTADERIETLETGADDFIAKPFHPRELLLRVKKRMAIKENGKPQSVHFLNLTLDAKDRVVKLNGKEVPLTPKQFDILYMLTQSPTSLVSREQFMDQVWGHREVSPRNVDSQINYIKKKLNGFDGEIESVSGYGYRLVTKAPSQ
jgi:DNA-binding response OmpR family regulator